MHAGGLGGMGCGSSTVAASAAQPETCNEPPNTLKSQLAATAGSGLADAGEFVVSIWMQHLATPTLCSSTSACPDTPVADSALFSGRYHVGRMRQHYSMYRGTYASCISYVQPCLPNYASYSRTRRLCGTPRIPPPSTVKLGRLLGANSR